MLEMFVEVKARSVRALPFHADCDCRLNKHDAYHSGFRRNGGLTLSRLRSCWDATRAGWALDQHPQVQLDCDRDDAQKLGLVAQANKEPALLASPDNIQFSRGLPMTR
jgi:hypothetical protein